MNRSLALLLIGLFFGGGMGFVLAAGYGVTLDGHDHGAADGHGGHAAAAGRADHAAHERMIDLAGGPSAPIVSAVLTPDPVSGWNLHVMTENFRYAPKKAGLSHQPGEGHAHLYAGDLKIARLYGPWMHIAELPHGTESVRVTLNANDHAQLAVDGQPVSVTVPVP